MNRNRLRFEEAKLRPKKGNKKINYLGVYLNLEKHIAVFNVDKRKNMEFVIAGSVILAAILMIRVIVKKVFH